MAVLKFRVYYEEDDSVYRDVITRHTQSFLDLNNIILKAFEFDSKHQSTFFRSNDHWQRGREISKEKYNKTYKVEPLLMAPTMIASEIKDPNQKFIFVYDFIKNWTFLVELINVTREEDFSKHYPAVVRVEGIGPSQYGTKGLVGDKLAEVEEKYDLVSNADGFVEEGESDEKELEETDEESPTEGEGEEAEF